MDNPLVRKSTKNKRKERNSRNLSKILTNLTNKGPQRNLVIDNIESMKHQLAWEVSNRYSAQYNSFRKIRTPDDGRLGPKHIVKYKSENKWLHCDSNINAYRIVTQHDALNTALFSGRMRDEWRIWKKLERSGRGLIRELSRHLPGGTEGNNQQFQLGWLRSRPRFESSTSRMRI
jgi:hypothetical protein